jgi:hypothetical protein
MMRSTPKTAIRNAPNEAAPQGAADRVQFCLALQEPLGELGVFVQGRIDEALVGVEDDDQGEGGDCFLQGLKPR